MDAPSNIKSGGLKFAEQQMQRHGWTEGKGLGKHEDGISEAIKVKVKCDSAGVGHNSAEQFTFHWWDHVFNKTASSISVEPDQDGVTVKKLSEDDGPAVSSKKPRKAMLHSNMLYGRFIKSATLTSGGEKPVEEPSSSSSDSSDSSEDEDSKLDLSSATKLSDEDLMKICGGRTAHKGARHGLTMSAKLSRIEEQERAFMEKYGKKEAKPKPTKSSSEVPSVEEINGNDRKMHKKKKQMEGNEEENNPSDSEIPKKKKKNKKRDCEESVADVPNGRDQDNVPSNEEDTTTSKKKRSKVLKNVEMAEDHKNDSSVEDETTRPAKKKKKRKTVENEESVIVSGHTEDSNHAKEGKEDGSTEEEAGKKKKRRAEDLEEMVNAEQLIACPEEEPKNKKRCEENDISTEEEENGRSRRRKKEVEKKEQLNDEEDTKATKKKKKSKHKDRKD